MITNQSNAERSYDAQHSQLPQVVVLGARFGGLWAARRLAKGSVDVWVVDRNNYHTFFPLVYQVAAAELTPGEVAKPVRSILMPRIILKFVALGLFISIVMNQENLAN